jgi:opacity protein-like surface antigen
MFLSCSRSLAPRTISVFALGVAASFVSAQGTPEHPYFVTGSLTLPTSSDLRDATADLGFGVGLGYTLPMRPLLSRLGQNSVQLTFNSVSGHGNSFNAFDLLFVERMPVGAGGSTSPYVGLGLGLTYVQIESDGTGGSGGGGNGGGNNGGSFQRSLDFGAAGSDSASKLQPALQLLAGLNLGPRSFVELGYRWAPELEGVRHDLATLTFGFRF